MTTLGFVRAAAERKRMVFTKRQTPEDSLWMIWKDDTQRGAFTWGQRPNYRFVHWFHWKHCFLFRVANTVESWGLSSTCLQDKLLKMASKQNQENEIDKRPPSLLPTRKQPTQLKESYPTHTYTTRHAYARLGWWDLYALFLNVGQSRILNRFIQNNDYTEKKTWFRTESRSVQDKTLQTHWTERSVQNQTCTTKSLVQNIKQVSPE